MRIVERMHDRGIAVSRRERCAPWDARAFVEMVKGYPAVRSGASGCPPCPTAADSAHRQPVHELCQPRAVGRLARSLADLGVRLLGGCCQNASAAHPGNAQLSARAPGEGEAVGMQTVTAALAPAGDAEKRPNGTFSRKLMDGSLCHQRGIGPPRGTDTKATQVKLEFIRQLAEGGVRGRHRCTDGSRGIPLMPPGDFIHPSRQRLVGPRRRATG